MDYSPILAKNFDISKIRYGPIKKSAVAKSVYVNYGGDKCVLQFPAMHVPYGISDSALLNKDKKDPSAKLPNYTMNVSFKGIDENPAVKNLFTKLQAIEEKIKQDVYENRVAWLNDRYDDMDTVVSRLFSSNIQLDKDKETKKVLNRYPPTFRAKVPSVSEIDDEGVVQTDFKFDTSDMENNEIQFGNIINNLKGAKAQLIVQLMGLWFAGGKYGCTWKILSGRFQVARSVKYTYVEDSDEEVPEKKEKLVESDEEDISPDIVVSSKQVPLSDDDEEETVEEDAAEEEEEEEEEEAPPPPPPKKAPVKKVVAKK
jgi:hypothetical protein